MKNVIDYLQDIWAQKNNDNVHPTHATYTEVMVEISKDVRKELNSLYKDGLIRVGETINGKYISNATNQE